MAYAYIDTSALAKWYLPETGADTFSAWMQRQEETCISSLSKIEFRSLLARRQRMDLLTPLQVQELYAIFQQDCQDGHLLHFPVTDQHILNAALMIESLPTVALRTLDALHLSIAHDISATIMATADKVMAQAAQLIGIEVELIGSPLQHHPMPDV
jgi:predicted nucleic acid-binding protein